MNKVLCCISSRATARGSRKRANVPGTPSPASHSTWFNVIESVLLCFRCPCRVDLPVCLGQSAKVAIETKSSGEHWRLGPLGLPTGNFTQLTGSVSPHDSRLLAGCNWECPQTHKGLKQAACRVKTDVGPNIHTLAMELSVGSTKGSHATSSGYKCISRTSRERNSMGCVAWFSLLTLAPDLVLPL